MSNDSKTQSSTSAPAVRRVEDFTVPASVARLGRLGLIAGLVGAVLLIVGWMTNPEQFFRSYLHGYLLWLLVALGCLGFVMIQHLTAGRWAFVVRRTFEAGSRTLIYLAALFIPIGLGIHSLYEWSHADVVANDALLQHKASFLNSTGWSVRSAIYFLVWLGLAFSLSRLSARQDTELDTQLLVKMRRIAAPGLVFLVITATFASIDWIMSLQPHWYSAIYGIWFVGCCGLAALGFLIPFAAHLAKQEPMAKVFRPLYFHDYGKLLMAFTMLWGYFSLSQFLIIWSANIPEEVTWYAMRTTGGWKPITVFLVLFHFFIPFLLLLSRDLKRNPKTARILGIWMLVMSWVDLYWHVVPAFAHGGEAHFSFHWLDAVAPIAVGGLWFFFFTRELGKRSLIPVHDPFVEEALNHG